MLIVSWIEAHPARAGAMAGWYQQLCSGLAAIAVLPLITRRLGEAEAGIWFAFQTTVTVVNLTDFGLGFVLARQVAYSLGAKEESGPVEPEGDFIATRQGWEGVSDIYALSRRLFWWIALAALVIVVIVYEFILPQGKLLTNSGPSTATAWYLTGAATLFALLSKPHQALLDGLGKVFATRFLTGTQLLMAGFGAVAVLAAGGRLAGMAVVVLLAAVLQYAALRWLVARLAGRELPRAVRQGRAVLLRFAKVALPMGVLNISAFLISAVQVPLVGSLLGPRFVPGYYLAQRLSQMVNQAVMQVVGPQLPLFTRQLAERRFDGAAHRLLRTARVVCLAAGAGNVIFLFGSPVFADWWMGPGHYVAWLTLVLLALDGWLMSSSVVWGQFVLCAGRNPFVWSTLISGVLNLVLIITLASRFSVAGIAAASLLAGLAINYWYVFLHGLRLLRQLRQKACIQ